MVFGFGDKSREEKHEEFLQQNSLRNQQGIAAIDAEAKDSTVDYPFRPNTEADTLRYTQGVEDSIITNLIHELRNHFIINPEKGEWEIPTEFVGYDEQGKPQYRDIRPKLNDIGILAVINQARPFLNRNMINSNFSEERISLLIKNAYLELHRDLLTNRQRYGLTYACDPSEISVILRIFLAYILPGPFRALNDGERRSNRSMYKSMEHHIKNMSGDMVQKKGVLSPGVF